MFQFFPQQTNPLRRAVTAAFRRDEAQAVADVFSRLRLSDESREAADMLAHELVGKMRADNIEEQGAQALLDGLDPVSAEGGAFIELTESLLRIPDEDTRRQLIHDKTAIGNWDKIFKYTPAENPSWLQRLVGKDNSSENTGEKEAARRLRAEKAEYSVKMLAAHFIGGKTIEDTVKKNKKHEKSGFCFSFALPCREALNRQDADRNYQQYINAIHTTGMLTRRMGVYASHSLSLKLSALCPFYRHICLAQVQEDLLPKLKHLFFLAKEYQIALCIEAEESSRLELSLAILEELAGESMLADYQGIGFTVQAYQKRAVAVIEFLTDLARRHHKRLMIRLVKGGQWEQEIQNAQAAGLNGYPVYTRKEHTDLAYLVCAQMLLDAPDAFYPQFATHNPETAAAIHEMAQEHEEYEFQCLHGLGERLYRHLCGSKNKGRRCRIYFPIGEYAQWLPYLVRRIADRSLLKHIEQDGYYAPHPADAVLDTQGRAHPAVPLPRHIYGKARLNAIGIDFSDDLVLQRLQDLMNLAGNDGFQAAPLTLPESATHEPRFVQNPANQQDAIGAAAFSRSESLAPAVATAKLVEQHWAQVPATQRADCLYRLADMLENCLPEMMNLVIREAGKTAAAALEEVRRAVDACRYYAREAETLAAQRTPLGTVVSLTPWHSPLAAFVSQAAAALAVGNAVIAKPAAQACLTAYRATGLMHACGIPAAALQLVLGGGDIGAELIRDSRINGVVFCGSTEAAKLINHTLGQRTDLPVFTAETGSQNIMIADSSADLNLLCRTVLDSAFRNAGQEQSALKVLCVQEEIADSVLDMLRHGVDNLIVGDPADASVCVGPMIDREAGAAVGDQLDGLRLQAASFHQSPLPPNLPASACFIAPAVVELAQAEHIQRDIFGPVLQVLRYRADQLPQLIEQINAKGSMSVCAVHSRLDSRLDHIALNIDAGSLYTNCGHAPATAGVRPFGGHGLSGSGPKAGAAFYLQNLSRGRWKMPALTREALPDSQALAGAEKLIHETGFSHETRVRLAGLAGQTRVHNLRYARTALEGCCGEDNLMSWRSPKHIWIDGGTLQSAFAALLQIAAAGMQAVVHNAHPLAGWHTRLNGILRISSHPQQQPFVSHMVALDLPEPSAKTALAARKGAIVRIIDATQGLDILQLFEEIAYSTDTTVAGSNFTLLAQTSAAAPEQLGMNPPKA